MTKIQQGLKPHNRKLVKTPANGKKLTGNQWQGTPQQLQFMSLWLTPDSRHFGNAYQSAITSGYSESYARQLASPALNNKWLQEYERLTKFTAEHINQSIQAIAIKANDSRSPDDTRLKALEILAKITGLIDSKQGTTVNIVTPILNGQSTLKPKRVTVSNDVIEQ